jgi:hypothetical protein
MAKKKEKVADKAPKQPVKNAAFYKKIAENLMRANDELAVAYDYAIKEKEEWFEIADKAHKDNKTVVEDIKQAVDATISTILAVHEVTGEINPIDIIYNVSMIERIIEAKYNPKTEEF